MGQFNGVNKVYEVRF